MGLSPQKSEQLFCRIRQEWVAALPEEYVRQALLQRMIHELGYPSELIAVEKALDFLPHLMELGKSLPERRADILCFKKNNSQLLPFVLIECKAVPLTDKTVNQVAGYNHYVGAPFIVVVNREEVRCGFRQKGDVYKFVSWLPTYEELSKAYLR